jgi:hypothetical protein
MISSAPRRALLPHEPPLPTITRLRFYLCASRVLFTAVYRQRHADTFLRRFDDIPRPPVAATINAR